MRILPIALLAAALGLGAAASAQAHDIKAPSVPAALQPPKGHKPFAIGHAAGVQIYGCTGGTWTLTAPRADLYNDAGKKKQWIHFAGPTWQHRDGSTVVGLTPPAGAVTVKAKAIPWLLLAAKSTAPGPFGKTMVRTTYIQRINTRGGLAPALPCSDGSVREVPYRADYVFWKKNEARRQRR